MFCDVGNAFFIIIFVFHEFLLEGTAAKKTLQSASMCEGSQNSKAVDDGMIRDSLLSSI